MLGEHVRNIRKKRGITLKELAEKTGLSIGYISQIERNLTDPSLSTLRKLSAALDIPTYLFMGGESSTGLTTRQADMMILSQPNSNVRYHLLTPMPNGNFVPQSLVIRFELEPHCKDGDLPVIHPSEEILLLEQGRCHAFAAPSAVLTPAALKAVYGIDVLVQAHPERGHPLIITR